MKNILKRHSKRFLALLLCLLSVLTILPSTAFAWTSSEGVTCSSSFGEYYVGADGGQYYSASSYQYLVYDENGSTTLKTMNAGSARRKYMLTTSSGESQQVYCVESGVDYKAATNAYTSKNGTNSSFFRNLPANAQYGIMLATVYGWEPGKASPVAGTNEDDYSLATQIIIWEYQQQLRTSPYDLNPNSYGVRSDNYLRTIQGRPAEQCYNWLLAQMAQHSTIPSFASGSAGSAQVHTLKYNQSTGKYSLTLTDTNNMLKDLNFSGGSGVTVTRSGNHYTFTSSQMLTTPVTLTCTKNTGGSGEGMLIWGRPGYQTMLTGTDDPVVFYVNLNSETYGTGKIVKTSEDGKMSGITFTVMGNGVNRTVTTGADGTVDIPDLMPGVYTVTEQSIDKYEPQSIQRVTIVSGHTSTVTFNNVLKRGSLKVTKTSEDGLVEGLKFRLYGTSLSGLAVDEYAVTDKNGVATFSNVLISGSSPYTLEEVDTAIRYVVPPAQNATVNWNQVTGASVSNILKKWNVTVTKSDAEAGQPQGDATLAGADYGIYNDGQLVDSYTTDAYGSFTTKYYICGDNWTVREITPSEGYLLDDTTHHIGAEAKNFVIEKNAVANNVTEQVVKGNIAIIKHTDDGSTQIETPEEGAVFEVFLAAVGSYENARETDRDILTCDENGFAQSKQLPYGVYTVRQVSGWEGRELMHDFCVFISSNGETYRYLINHAFFESYIKIVKVDAETGNTIPYAGAGFELYRPDGSPVSMTFTYPTVTTIDTFYTNDEGTLVTPEKLEYGSGYSLVKVQAPYGYVLDSTPISFDVAQEASEEEGGVTVIKVERPNMAQKGVIHVEKTGEVFQSVTEASGLYQPVYSVQGLPGAVYEIIAAEDIVTLDGTLHAAKGEVVDTVTTDENGRAVSKELYLGKYTVIERTAPHGMVLNSEPHTVELTYAGQEISVTETSTSFYNERQRVEITLQKALEQDEQYGIGMGGEIFDVTFGLYAAEELTAADGSVIPADGLIEIISLDENGRGTCQSDLPLGSYYLKELSTHPAYLPSDTKYPVVFEYAGQETATVTLAANEGSAISNELMRGKIQGLKTDEDKKTLDGAVIGLFRQEETEFTTETALLTAASTEDGSFSFENVPYGTWLVREIESPAGFVLTEEAFAVTVDKDGAVIEVSMENIRIRGNVQLTKVDKDYPDNKLTGAAFEVYADSNGDKKLDKDDVLIGTLAETETGVYGMTDLLSGGYFVKETAAPEGFVLDDTAHYFNIEKHGETVIVETEEGKGFLNEAQKGMLKILKTSDDKKVDGFSFRVTGPNGYDQTFKTDSNGEILIEGLRISEYTVSEVKNDASSGYVLPDDKKITVSFGATVTVEMHNTVKDTPKTGDDSNVGLWIVFAGASLLGVGTLIFLGCKSRQKSKED